MSTFLHDLLARIASRIAVRRRLSGFTCADCERQQRCGLPPSDNCIHRIEQMSREDQDMGRRVKALAPW